MVRQEYIEIIFPVDLNRSGRAIFQLPCRSIGDATAQASDGIENIVTRLISYLARNILSQLIDGSFG
jgi:hypothetical protein